MINRYLPVFLTVIVLFLQISVLSGEHFFIAPLVSVCMLAAWFLYRSPETGMLLLAFVIPFEGLFRESTFTGAKLIGLSLILVAAVRVLLQKSSLRVLQTPVQIPLLFFLLSFVLSSLLSDYSGLSLHFLRQLFTAVAIFYIALLFAARINLHFLARVVAASVAITAIIAVLSSNEITEGRAIGLLSDPNYFALLLVTAIPLTIYLIIYERYKSLRMVWGLALVIKLVAFQQTMSRSGLLVLVVVLLLIAFNYKYLLAQLTLSQLCLCVTLIFLLIGLTIGILPPEYQDRILSLSSLSSGVKANEDRSLSRRTSYLIVGIDVFKNDPFLGAGPGTFPVKYAESGFSVAYSPSKDKLEIFRRAHNTYLETLAETGLFGLCSLLVMIVMGVNCFIKGRRYELENGNIVKAQQNTFFCISFISIVLFFLFLSVPTNKYFWIYLAVGCSLTSHVTKRNEINNSR